MSSELMAINGIRPLCCGQAALLSRPRGSHLQNRILSVCQAPVRFLQHWWGEDILQVGNEIWLHRSRWHSICTELAHEFRDVQEAILISLGLNSTHTQWWSPK